MLKSDLILLKFFLNIGVNIKINLYEDAFHGIIAFVKGITGYKVAQKMLGNIVLYIQENI